MGRLRFDVRTIRCIGTIDMVGIFVGYYGTSHLFRDLWNCDGCIRLLLFNETGNRIFCCLLFSAISSVCLASVSSIWFFVPFDKTRNHFYRNRIVMKWKYNINGKFLFLISVYNINMRISHYVYVIMNEFQISKLHLTHTHSHIGLFVCVFLHSF